MFHVKRTHACNNLKAGCYRHAWYEDCIYDFGGHEGVIVYVEYSWGTPG